MPPDSCVDAENDDFNLVAKSGRLLLVDGRERVKDMEGGEL